MVLMRDRLRSLLHCSVGRRGAFLVTHGVLYLVYGYSLITSVSRRSPERKVLYSVVEMVASLRWWGLLWMASGLLAVVSAGSWRWRHMRAIAFAGLMGVSTLWAVGLGAADLAPGVSGTSSWIAGSLFLSLMAGIAVVAGWPENPK